MFFLQWIESYMYTCVVTENSVEMIYPLVHIGMLQIQYKTSCCDKTQFWHILNYVHALTIEAQGALAKQENK